MGYINKELFVDYSLEINDDKDIVLIVGTNCRRLSFLIHSDENYPDIQFLKNEFECIFHKLKEAKLLNLDISVYAERYYIFFSLSDSTEVLKVSGSVQ